MPHDRTVAKNPDQASAPHWAPARSPKKNAQSGSRIVNSLADVTNAILQPEPRNGLETGSARVPEPGRERRSTSPRRTRAVSVGLPVINNFANPMQFICSAIQAGSRLRGYPGVLGVVRAVPGPDPRRDQVQLPAVRRRPVPRDTLPKQVTYSEPRLQPPPGYKDTTVPGIFSRDTLFSHGNHEPGWRSRPACRGRRAAVHGRTC